MQSEVKGGNAFSYVNIKLAPEESLITKSGVMSSMSADMTIKASAKGRFLQAVWRILLGPKSIIIDRFSNNTDTPISISIAPSTPGDIRCIELGEDALYLRPEAFTACTNEVKLGLRWAGLTSFIAREGLFNLVLSGTGKVWYGAYGTFIEKEVDGKCYVNTSHIIAYHSSLSCKPQLVSRICGKRALVSLVSGQGKITTQSRSTSSLSHWLNLKF